MEKRKEIKRSWWYRILRAIHYYAYRYWGLFLLGFFLLLGLWIWMCYLPYCQQKKECCLIDDYKKKVHAAQQAIEECCACSSTILIEDDEIDELRRDYGGSIGEVTVTLAWKTTDDLDLYIMEPSGEVIYFDNKVSKTGGRLDVDKNRGEYLTSSPIENVFYSNKPSKGKYGVFVHYYGSYSSTSRIPYKVLIKIGGEQKQFNGTHYTVGEMHDVYEFIIP